MRGFIVVVLCLLVHPRSASAEVTSVTVTSRTTVASGQSFGNTGPYERLVGRIEFALDPADPHNTGIADLDRAPRDSDGRVRFSSALYVLRPTDPSKGNGVLLFDVANRGRRSLLGRFNRAAPGNDPTTDADFGDGLLMRDGYTLVSIGWEIDVPAPLLRIDAPPALLPEGSDDRLSVEIMHNQHVSEVFLVDDPAGRPPVIYPPADGRNPTDVLTVRDRFWGTGEVIPRERWHFVVGPDNLPKLRLDTGFEPGRYYRVTYRATGALVAGAGLAAIRDAAAGFRYRSDLPIHGARAYAFGVSQTGRFLRQFLYEGFNVDERDRRVFDAMWMHVAGASRVGINERFATPTLAALFTATQFPFADVEQVDVDGARGSMQARYRPEQRPKIFYTNTPVEYWGGGRAAALTHTTVDGNRDLELPDNVRMYLLAGTQHIVAPFPPVRSPPVSGMANPAARSGGQQLNNPTPQNNVMRALLRALYEWETAGTVPPPSQYPRLGDRTLVRIDGVKFPALRDVADPRRITGPARLIGGKVVPLPHLVPQVDRDGNDLGGIRDPEVAVPLATTTGWNFRDPSVGNPDDIYQLLGSYIPFAPTRAARQATGDPRLSVEERYRGVDDYLQRIRSSAMDLIRRRYLLAEDLDSIVERAKKHWTFATREEGRREGQRRIP
jgi:Alpha/beta hydrolase domain